MFRKNRPLGSIISFLLILVLGLQPLGEYFGVKAAYSPVGRIYYKQGVRLIQLSGSYYRMGFDHGYLLGPDIMHMIEDYEISTLLGGNVSGYESALQRVRTQMNFDRYAEELQGMYDGMVEAGTDLYLDTLSRNLTVDDLKLWNANYDTGLLNVGCTSFAVWGNTAGNGDTLQARNMDFHYDQAQGYAARLQTVGVYQPEGKQSFVGVIWPGYVGTGTAMNDSGLAFTVNVADGIIDTEYTRNDYIPSSLSFRRALEDSTGSGDLITQYYDSISTAPRTRSVNIQLSQPLEHGGVASQIFEVDANGIDRRNPISPNEFVFTANHFVQRYTPTPSQNNTLERWAIMSSALPNYTTTGDGLVDLTEARTLLQQLADANSMPTLLSAYLKPRDKSFSIAFATTVGSNPVQLTESPFVTPVSFTWDELFAPAPSITPTLSPTETPDPTISSTPTPTDSITPTPLPTITPLPTPTSTPTPVNSTLTFQVSSGTNDVFQEGNSFYPSGSTLWIGGDSTQYTGLRYTGVNIPPGSDITEAYLEFYSAANQWISTQFDIYGEYNANPLVFSTSALPSARARTTASSVFNSDANWTISTWYRMPDIRPVIQEIIDRPDWNSGNPLVIITHGTGGRYGRKRIASYEGGAANSPRLTITYTANVSTTPTPTPTPLPTPTSTPLPTPTATPLPTPTPTVIPTPTPTPLPYALNASQYTISRGTYRSGNLSSTTTNDNNYLVSGSSYSGLTAYNWQDFTFNLSPETPVEISLTVIARASRSSTSTALYVYNNPTASWNQLTSYSLGTSEVTRNYTISGNLVPYINSQNQVGIRIGTSRFLSTHDLSTELIRLDIR